MVVEAPRRWAVPLGAAPQGEGDGVLPGRAAAWGRRRARAADVSEQRVRRPIRVGFVRGHDVLTEGVRRLAAAWSEYDTSARLRTATPRVLV